MGRVCACVCEFSVSSSTPAEAAVQTDRDLAALCSCMSSCPGLECGLYEESGQVSVQVHLSVGAF